MQLFQDYRLAGWSLPPRWQIVLTANPDGGDYSVTPMDNAMLTRMLHITMRFDARRWAAWAEDAGIDPRGIAFVLTYPEMISGERTTPRSLVQFFDRIADIDDLESRLDLVTILGESCLDKGTVAAFIAYVEESMGDLVTPEEILGGMAAIEPRLRRMLGGATPRVDMLSAVCTRLVHHLNKRNSKALSKQEFDALSEFLSHELLPEDMRLALAQELMALPAKLGVAKLLGDPKLARLLLSLRGT